MVERDESPRAKRRENHGPASHRARSHDSAHADIIPPPPASERPEHPLIPAGEATLIATQEALTELLAHLREIGSFAYDSEFIGELTYIPKLCLIQVASSERIALIDPLAPAIDLLPFWELICDPSVEKIVHAGQQDIEPVIRHTSREPQNLFDTQMAAGFVGMAYPVSLSRLVEEVAGARLGKGLTFTHWDQRPLSGMQLRYAADDVRYLPAIRAQLGEKLAALDHTDWAKEEFATLCDASQYRFDRATYYRRVRGATSLQPQQIAILQELTAWRDQAARAHNVPPRSLVRDEIMIDMARSPVKTLEKLSRVRGLPRPVEAGHGAEIVEATQRALALPPSTWPDPREPDRSPTERFNSDALWAAAQCLCIGRSIDPALAASRQDIAEFYRYLSEPSQIESDLRVLKGWRRKAIGDPLMTMVKKGGKLAFEWKNGAMQAI